MFFIFPAEMPKSRLGPSEAPKNVRFFIKFVFCFGILPATSQVFFTFSNKRRKFAENLANFILLHWLKLLGLIPFLFSLFPVLIFLSWVAFLKVPTKVSRSFIIGSKLAAISRWPWLPVQIQKLTKIDQIRRKFIKNSQKFTKIHLLENCRFTNLVNYHFLTKFSFYLKNWQKLCWNFENNKVFLIISFFFIFEFLQYVIPFLGIDVVADWIKYIFTGNLSLNLNLKKVWIWLKFYFLFRNLSKTKNNWFLV